MNIVEWRDNLSKVPRDKLSGYAKLVGYTLSLFYRSGNRTYPTKELLASRASIGKGTVNNSIKELIDAGIIQVSKDVLPGEKSPRNFYIFVGLSDAKSLTSNNLEASSGERSSGERLPPERSPDEHLSNEHSIHERSNGECLAEGSRGERSPDEHKIVYIDLKKEKERETPSQKENLKNEFLEKMKTLRPEITPEAAQDSWKRFENHYPTNKLAIRMEDWIFGEKKIKMLVAIPPPPKPTQLTEQEKLIARLGDVAFEKKLGKYVGIEKEKFLERWEKRYGKVWWMNIAKWEEKHGKITVETLEKYKSMMEKSDEHRNNIS